MKVYIVKRSWVLENDSSEDVKVFDTLEKARQCFENEVYDILNGGDYDNPIEDDGGDHNDEYIYNKDEWSFEIWKDGYYCGDNQTVNIYKVEVE